MIRGPISAAMLSCRSSLSSTFQESRIGVFASKSRSRVIAGLILMARSVAHTLLPATRSELPLNLSFFVRLLTILSPTDRTNVPRSMTNHG